MSKSCHGSNVVNNCSFDEKEKNLIDDLNKYLQGINVINLQLLADKPCIDLDTKKLCSELVFD